MVILAAVSLLLLILAITGSILISASATFNEDAPAGPAPIDSSLRLTFDNWLEKHGKRYIHKDDDDEYELRLAVFAANAELVARHNDAHSRGLTSYAMSLDGPFADMTDEEFESKFLMDPQHCSATHTSSGSVPRAISSDPLPSAWDWRTEGIVTPIKAQEHCGSCWTFSTTGALEAHHCKQLLIDCSSWTGLAEQQLVDCAGAYNNHGCQGGLPSQAFEYIHFNGGIVAEEAYNYTAKNGHCNFDKARDRVAAMVNGVFNITSGDEDEIIIALYEVGPVSVAYQVAPDFKLYSHGVYDSYNATTKRPNCLGDEMHVNHAVVAVGYGETMTSEKVPFYIVRNSWGNTWGMEGYFWMVRGKNMCGVSDCASYPIVSYDAGQHQLPMEHIATLRGNIS